MRRWIISMTISTPAAAEALGVLAAALVLAGAPAATAAANDEQAGEPSPTASGEDPGAGDAQAPPAEFLAYLGRWDSADAGWLELIGEAADEVHADEGEQDDE